MLSHASLGLQNSVNKFVRSTPRYTAFIIDIEYKKPADFHQRVFKF
jgi:hypothetical protein